MNTNMTKIRTYVFASLLLTLFLGSQAKADFTSSREYQVKAAFLYNFIMFVDWPQEKIADNNEPVIIGIIGDDPFGNAFDPIKDKQAESRKIIIKRFEGLEELKKSDHAQLNQKIEAIRGCHLLFICRSEKNVVNEIMNLLKGSNVLVVGDTDGFLESKGGIINFTLQDEKVRFEVDLDAARQANLKIRSQLLRLAQRVIG
jgi:hypothetical protein